MKKRTIYELILRLRQIPGFRPGKVEGLTKEGLLILIHLYRYTFSILFGPCCRFTPSCSSYALLSIHRFGIMEGAWLIFKRLIKCHPFHPGGYDPVPDIIKKS
jgi:putative membrane protein insertion efficiency factor